MSIDQEMNLDQIRAALVAAEEDVTPEQLEAVKEFIRRIGGIENARAALEMLHQDAA